MNNKLLFAGLAAVTAVYSSAGFAGGVDPSEVISFVNETPYTLQLADITPTATDYCVNEQYQQADCNAILTPGQRQLFYIENSSGLNVGYNINTTSVSYYNLDIQSWGSVTFSATAISGDQTQYNSGDNAIDFSMVDPTRYAGISQYSSLQFRGINLSGAEAGSSYLASWLPNVTDAQYFVNEGMNTVRFPINWNYIVQAACSQSGCTNTEVNGAYLDSIYSTTRQLLLSGVNVIFDVHDYMRFTNNINNGTAGNGNVVSPQLMATLWEVIAQKFAPLAKQYDGKKTTNQLIFELNNEPNSMPTEQVLENSNAAIAVIRKNGVDNLILIEGNQWSGLHSWTTAAGTDGLTNAQVLIPSNIQDSDNNYAIAVHEYFDSNGSGTSADCQTLSSFQTYSDFTDFMSWVHQYKVKVILDEFGSGSEQNCVDDVNWLLGQMEANPYTSEQGGFIGWTAWVGGHGWSVNNFNNLAPINGVQTTQMTQIYELHLTAPAATVK